MAKRWVKWGWMLVLAAPATGQARVDLTVLDQDMAGPRAQVLVLGSVHLSGMAKGFRSGSLNAGLDRLAAFKPDVITIEALSGEECDLAARHPSDPETVRKRVEETVASCAKGIGETPLLPLPSSGRSELTYACGLVCRWRLMPPRGTPSANRATFSACGANTSAGSTPERHGRRRPSCRSWPTGSTAIPPDSFARRWTSPADPDAFLRAGLA